MQNTYSKETDYSRFPIGTHVRNVSQVVDFFFFRGDETGTVIKNDGTYLGIIVKFDEPLEFRDGTTKESHNFEPRNLEIIAAQTTPEPANAITITSEGLRIDRKNGTLTIAMSDEDMKKLRDFGLRVSGTVVTFQNPD